tara:strand:+ start:758 stop:1195 length:438 start_codon:yes stop_codon:yes gene_type:complete
MAKINGTSLLILISGNAVAHTTSASLSFDMDTIDVSTKDSAGVQELLAGQKSASVDFEAMVDFGAQALSDNAGTNMQGLDDLFSTFNNRSQITWSLETEGDSTVGAPKFSGSGFITSLSMEAPMEDVTTFSGSIAVTGAVTFTES